MWFATATFFFWLFLSYTYFLFIIVKPRIAARIFHLDTRDEDVSSLLSFPFSLLLLCGLLIRSRLSWASTSNLHAHRAAASRCFAPMSSISSSPRGSLLLLICIYVYILSLSLFSWLFCSYTYLLPTYRIPRVYSIFVPPSKLRLAVGDSRWWLHWELLFSLSRW